MITDLQYMQSFGLSLKEARQTRRSRSDLNTTWHAWRREEYMYPALSYRIDQKAPGLDSADEKSKTFASPLARLPPSYADYVPTLTKD
ncbi:MAG: hypothetical protein LQ343_007911 [Gyalolechia ehrenbergii]|nr:MAG: hypothetical protein LQ343_007911 [Gyalolechia ehrenbergii]